MVYSSSAANKYRENVVVWTGATRVCPKKAPHLCYVTALPITYLVGVKIRNMKINFKTGCMVSGQAMNTNDEN